MMPLRCGHFGGLQTVSGYKLNLLCAESQYGLAFFWRGFPKLRARVGISAPISVMKRIAGTATISGCFKKEKYSFLISASYSAFPQVLPH